MNSFTQEADPLSHQESTEKGTSNVLSRRLNSILETRLENDKDTLEALKELSTFFPENTLQTRRNLRSKIEKRSLVINEDFLSAFREVKEALDDIYADVVAMNASVQSMTGRLQDTRTKTRHLIDQTTGLQAEGRRLCMRGDTATAFLAAFQLTPSQLESLRGKARDSPVTPEFFVALERVQTIHRDCRALMQSGLQTAALDIMEQTALYQETAVERLYRWTQANTRNVEQGDVLPLLAQAMTHLRDRPALFDYVLDEYCASRRSLLVRAFVEALTVGGPGGNPRPIELNAHDPRRYLGDVLAWLHQAMPGERDNLAALLGDGREQMDRALCAVTDGVCHPLRVRVEHVLAGDAPAVVLHAVANLVRFYRRVIGRSVPGGRLEATLAELEGSCEGRFLEAFEGEVLRALHDGEGPPPDLAPPPGVGRLLRLLREVLSAGGVAEGRHGDLVKVVARAVDPAMAAVNEGASRLPPVDMAVHLLNCVQQVRSALSLYEFVDDRLERLDAQADAHLDTLVSEQAGSLVANLNLGPIYAILREHGGERLSSVPGMEADSLRTFLEKLDNFLAMPDALLLPQMGLLVSGSHRSTAKRRAFEVIAAVYRQLYSAVHDPANGYQNPGLLMRRPPDEVLQALMG